VGHGRAQGLVERAGAQKPVEVPLPARSAHGERRIFAPVGGEPENVHGGVRPFSSVRAALPCNLPAGHPASGRAFLSCFRNRDLSLIFPSVTVFETGPIYLHISTQN